MEQIEGRKTPKSPCKPLQESPLQFPEKLRVLSAPAKSPKSPRVKTVKMEIKAEPKSPQRIRQNQPQRFRSPQPNRRGPAAEPKLEFLKLRILP